MDFMLTAVLFFFGYGPVTALVRATPYLRELLDAFPTAGNGPLLWPVLLLMATYGLVAAAERVGSSLGALLLTTRRASAVRIYARGVYAQDTAVTARHPI